MLLPRRARLRTGRRHLHLGAARVGERVAWVDANADGKADYCRADHGQHGRARARSRPAPASAPRSRRAPIDAGFAGRRARGATSTATSRADYCRRVGGGARRSTGSSARARPATASSPTARAPRSTGLGPRHRDRRRHRRRPRRLLPPHRRRAGAEHHLHDVDRPASAPPRAPARSTPVEPAGRAWVDFDGDGRADFCRVRSVSDALVQARSAGRSRRPARRRLRRRSRLGRRQRRRPRATTAAASATAEHVRSSARSRPAPASGRRHVRRGSTGATTRGYAWRTSTATATATSAARVGASVTTVAARSARSGPPTASPTRTVSGVDRLGYATDRAWVDHNGDGKADYCRRVGNGGARRARRRARSPTAPGSASRRPPRRRTAPTPAPRPATPAKPARIVVTLVVLRSPRAASRRSPSKASRAARPSAPRARRAARARRYTKRNASGDRQPQEARRRAPHARSGTTITVTVTHAGQIGAVKTLQMRAGRNPQAHDPLSEPGLEDARRRCLARGLRAPQAADAPGA